MCNDHIVFNSQLPPTSLDTEYLPQLIDVHCHLQEDYETGLSEIRVGKMAIMGTQLEDWDKVSGLHGTYCERVIPGYGIHPWFSEKTLGSVAKSDSLHKNTSSLISKELKAENGTWLDTLRKKLEEYPNSIVGEIGLDKLAVDPISKKRYNMSSQKVVFFQQLQLAYIYQRPVSIHCVRAWGQMAEILETIRHDLLLPPDDPSKKSYGFPPKIMFHSFMGSTDTVKRLERIFTFNTKQSKQVHTPPTLSCLVTTFQPPHIYFSFSELVNNRNLDKLQETLKIIPRDRILLESDMGSAKVVDVRMVTIAKAVASALNMELKSIYQLASINAITFFS